MGSEMCIRDRYVLVILIYLIVLLFLPVEDYLEIPHVTQGLIQLQFLLVLLIGIVALGVVRPMLNKILVPTASTNSVMELYAEAETMAEVAAKRATETEAVEVDEGESLDEIKAKLKPKKKGGISADMLDTANTYDDKVALVRIIVTDEAGRVANVFKQMMREDLEVLK